MEKVDLESDFQKLPPWIQCRIENIRELLNKRITKGAPENKEVWFSDNGGQAVNRKVTFKLVESEDGNKTCVFDYLA